MFFFHIKIAIILLTTRERYATSNSFMPLKQPQQPHSPTKNFPQQSKGHANILLQPWYIFNSKNIPYDGNKFLLCYIFRQIPHVVSIWKKEHPTSLLSKICLCRDNPIFLLLKVSLCSYFFILFRITYLYLRITQARKHALKPRADVKRSPKHGYQWPHKKDLYPPNI